VFLSELVGTDRGHIEVLIYIIAWHGIIHILSVTYDISTPHYLAYCSD